MPMNGGYIPLWTAKVLRNIGVIRCLAIIGQACYTKSLSKAPNSNHQCYTLHDLSQSGAGHMAVLIATILDVPAVSADHSVSRHPILHKDSIHQRAQGTHSSSFASFPTVLSSGMAV